MDRQDRQDRQDKKYRILVSFLNFIEQSKILKSKGFPPFEKGGPGGI
jgi:hypothetical protein